MCLAAIAATAVGTSVSVSRQLESFSIACRANLARSRSSLARSSTASASSASRATPTRATLILVTAPATMSSVEVLHQVRIPTRLPWQQKLAELVADPQLRFIAAAMGRQAGKTSGMCDIGGEFALERPRRRILWTAPRPDLFTIGKERFLDYWRPAMRDYSHSEERGTFWNGSEVFFRSVFTGDAAIGRNYDLVISDEAARTSDDAIRRAIIPAVMIRRGKIVAPSTPKGSRNFFAQWVKKARSGDWPAYGFMSGPSTENPSPHVREFIETMRAEMPDAVFRQEILAEFLDDAGAVFRGVRDILGSSLVQPVPGREYVAGCDLAKHEDFTVLYATDIETGETSAGERFHQLPWPQIIQRCADFSSSWNNAPLFLDSTGVGDPVFDDLVNRGLPVHGVKFTNDTKSGLVIGLAKAIESKEIRIHEDEGLLAELEIFAFEQLPSGRYRYSAPEGFHDDRVIALALAVYGRRAAPHQGLMSFMKKKDQAKSQERKA